MKLFCIPYTHDISVSHRYEPAFIEKTGRKRKADATCTTFQIVEVSSWFDVRSLGYPPVMKAVLAVFCDVLMACAGRFRMRFFEMHVDLTA